MGGEVSAGAGLASAVLGWFWNAMAVTGCVILGVIVLLLAGYLVALWMEKRPAEKTPTQPSQVLGDDVIDMLRETRHPAVRRQAPPSSRDDDVFYADGMAEALRWITEEDGRG